MHLAPPGRGFISTYALAYAGLFVAFVPLLTVFLPLKAAAIAPADRVGLLSSVSLVGALAASAANIAFGAASDWARHRLGWSRRPIILAGLFFTLSSYLAIYFSASPLALHAAIIYFQISLNMMFAPLAAVLADAIPNDRRGAVAGLLGGAGPVGAVATVFATQPALPGEGHRLVAVCVLVVLMILPHLLLSRATDAAARRVGPETGTPATERRGTRFALIWLSRLTMQIGANGLALVAFYFFEERLSSRADGATDAEATHGVATIMAIAQTVALVTSIAVGRSSDIAGARKPFILGSALSVALGLALMLVEADWRLSAVGYGVAVAGVAAFTATHSALAIALLPSARDHGRDLGVLNLANTLPSMAAPMLVVAFDPDKLGYETLFACFAVAALAAGLIPIAVRGVR